MTHFIFSFIFCNTGLRCRQQDLYCRIRCLHHFSPGGNVHFLFLSVRNEKHFFPKSTTTYFFNSSRALRCVRNEIHTHLFVASILHNASWLLWYGAVIYRFDTIHNWTVCFLFPVKFFVDKSVSYRKMNGWPVSHCIF